MVRNEHILYFRLLDPRMVDSSIMFTKYVSEWATNLRAISLNVGVTTFGPPCICTTLVKPLARQLEHSAIQITLRTTLSSWSGTASVEAVSWSYVHEVAVSWPYSGSSSILWPLLYSQFPTASY